MHGARPTPDPHRILGFHPDMGWRGEMVPSATPPRRKAAPKIGVAAAGQPKAAKVSPGHRSAPPEHTGGGSGKIQTEPGTGKGCMEGKGAIPPDLARLRLAVLTAEPSGTPHATPAGAAALDPMASAKKKRRRPRRHLPRRPRGLSRRSSPVAARGWGRWGEAAGENPRLPRVALGATRGTGGTPH